MTTLTTLWQRLTTEVRRSGRPLPTQTLPRTLADAPPGEAAMPTTFAAVLRELVAMNHELAMTTGSEPAAEA